jgi:hypothetical protein
MIMFGVLQIALAMVSAAVPALPDWGHEPALVDALHGLHGPA